VQLAKNNSVGQTGTGNADQTAISLCWNNDEILRVNVSSERYKDLPDFKKVYWYRPSSFL